MPSVFEQTFSSTVQVTNHTSKDATMMMEFQAIDAIVPAGHGIRLVMSDTGMDYLAPACGNACVLHVLPSLSEMGLPLIQRNETAVLTVPSA